MTDRPVITRFAPSPTGTLHIGGARTALFNWLFAKANNGKFLLRIEDTDRERSTDEATQAIFRSMKWLGLQWDGEAVSQNAQRDRHAQVAAAMLENGTAYRCYSTPDEITAIREVRKAAGKPTLFESPWRDATPPSDPDTPFVVRLRSPIEGRTEISDAVQGRVSWANETLDDLVLLRSDGTPTYMLAVVVDDHDMEVSHIIRGDDHLSNAARQTLIYNAMDWPVPVFAHIPLIYGPDGKKMSKRHGATGAEEYQKLGYPAAAMRNYLAKLGWAHCDDEFFTTQQAIDWFSLAAVKKAPARFDFKKLDSISGLHIASMSDEYLLFAINNFIDVTDVIIRSDIDMEMFKRALPFVREKSKTLADLLNRATFATASRPIERDEKSNEALSSVSIGILNKLTKYLEGASWARDALEQTLTKFAEAHDLKLGKIAQPMRAALAGRTATPSMFDMMLVLGRDETLARIKDVTTASV
jgi:glutamyl-tRNA synthetase